MENNDWSTIKGNTSAPYINSLLAVGAHAEQYYNPPGNHPSEPNYLWLEAGTNFGVLDDDDPSVNSQTTTAHLVTQLTAAGHTWKAYEEDISGTVCPLTEVADYATKHCPMVFFTDVTADNSATAPICIAHVRPYSELATDLAANTTADYNFITPNLCDDMHGASDCTSSNYIQLGDTWLSQQLPVLFVSTAYQNGAIILITWDEGVNDDGPIGMIALGKSAKVGYSNTVHYTHSSTLRTVQEIFGLSPFLGDAATVGTNDLSDLFTQLP
jgi:phosphatidylinositol-3-phosphatase